MGNVTFPEKISGQWIYLKRLKNRQDMSVLLRRNFFAPEDMDGDPLLLVSANTSYQLFINGRLAGVGPRAHQSPGTSFIDAHEIGFYLEPGNNLISFHIHRCNDLERGDFLRTPGVWCQLQCGGKTLLQSDESWEIMALENFNLPRPRVSLRGRLSTFTDMRIRPAGWNISGKEAGKQWGKPDSSVMPGLSGALIELHPVPPAVISSEPVEFETVCRGQVSAPQGFSCCPFMPESVGRVGAAAAYVFCEESRSLKLKIYSDDPCKLFCNKEMIFECSNARGKEIEIIFASGMNRITLFSKLSYSSMGVMFTGSPWPAELTFLSDMLDTADPGWCVGTVSRLKYEDCTPAVRVEALPDLMVIPTEKQHVNDIWDWLDNARIMAVDRDKEFLKEGEFALFKLPKLTYGSVRCPIIASDGDIVDLIIGTELGENRLFPQCANINDREVISCICREGENELSSFIPADCRCVLFYVRKAEKCVKVAPPVFDELLMNSNRECTFSCSDPFWNQIWQNGKSVLARSSVAVFPSDGCRSHDAYLLDSFWESVNTAAVFGDAGYITSRLRQFAGSQLENGSIVSLSSGAGYDQGLFHMFFFPGWILYNYRFTGNMVELRSLMPKLDAAKKYLMSLLDEERNLLSQEAVENCSGCETDPVVSCRLPVVMNALFCRFMLSASEVFELAERSFDARECRRLVQRVTKELIVSFYDAEAGLFSNYPLTGGETEIEFSLLGNFFPLLAGIKTGECFETFVRTFFDFETAEAKTVEAESPYFHYLFAEMLFALGQREWGARYLKRYWSSRMSDAGAWKDPVSNVIHVSRFSEGHTVVPNTLLLREFLGIRIGEAAFSLVYFDPAYDLLDQCEAAIPTIYGRMHVTWKKQPDGGLEVNIYSSHPMKVMPALSEDMLKKSTFCLSENVMLVKSSVKEQEA